MVRYLFHGDLPQWELSNLTKQQIGTSSMACDTACDEDWDLSQSKQTNIIIPYNMVEKTCVYIIIYIYIYVYLNPPIDKRIEPTNMHGVLSLHGTGVDWNPTAVLFNFWKCNQH